MLAAAVGAGLSWQLNHRFDEAQEREAKLDEYVGQARLFDEVLTMSARMAAATGDSSYKQRYDKFDAELDTLIKETANALGLSEVRQFVEQTDDANRKLVEMERRACSNPLRPPSAEPWDSQSCISTSIASRTSTTRSDTRWATGFS